MNDSAVKDTNSTIKETVVPSTSSSTAASSSSSSNTVANEKFLEPQTHLRSFGRPDVRREGPKILGWTLARWILLLSNILILLYGSFFLIGSLVTFGKGYDRAIVILVANIDILIVTFTASLLCVSTAILGIIGTRYRDRRLLGIYSLLLWPCFILITAVGYLAFKDDTWNLKAKLGTQWRHHFTPANREALQDNLHCCGFENPMDHATYFARCWPESLLPGCAYKFYLFESSFLSKAYTISFAIIPLHILVIIASFLCSNHVDHLFGSRARPQIPYLGKFSDWRDWEREQKRLKEDSVSSLEPARTRASATGHNTTRQITSRHSNDQLPLDSANHAAMQRMSGNQKK